ncbi:hypothetical protein MTP99_018699 [Tenebrio molitor]|jgi:hypothetical protein|nr:hypothetical protein MTP99_018699 [Tenebrio molitor]
MSTAAATLLGTVRIKCTCTPLLQENLDRISVLFAARLEEHRGDAASKDDFLSYEVHSLAPSGCERAPSADFISRLQVCGAGGNDTRI